MSLILEALRKSEAERRRGEAPDLHAELAPAPPARRRRRVPTVMATTAAVAALLVVGLVAWQRRPAPDPVATAPDAAPEARAPAASAPGGRTARDDQAQPVPALPPVERLRPPRPAVDAAPRPVTPGAPPAGRSGAGAAVAGVDGPEATAPAAAAGREDSRSPARPLPAAPEPPTASAPAPARVPTIAELGADARRQLPPMKLTLHMWNEDPARRFVILDGTRHVEGDRVGSGRITAIDSDGVVIELDGRPVRLPLR